MEAQAVAYRQGEDAHVDAVGEGVLVVVLDRGQREQGRLVLQQHVDRALDRPLGLPDAGRALRGLGRSGRPWRSPGRRRNARLARSGLESVLIPRSSSCCSMCCAGATVTLLRSPPAASASTWSAPLRPAASAESSQRRT